LRAALPFHGAQIRGVDYPSMPSAVLSLLTNANSPGAIPTSVDVVRAIPTEWVISGSQSISIFVEER